MPQVGTLGGAIFWYQTDNCYIYSCLQNSSFLQDAFTHACMLPASNFSLPLKQSFLGRSSFQNSTELEVKKKKRDGVGNLILSHRLRAVWTWANYSFFWASVFSFLPTSRDFVKIICNMCKASIARWHMVSAPQLQLDNITIIPETLVFPPWTPILIS